MWLILAYDWPCPHEAGKALHLMDRKDKAYTPFTRLATGLLMSSAWIQHKIVQYWWWFLRQWCRDVALGTVSVLLREAISHPYISFFHLLVNGFPVTCNNNNYHFHQLLQTGFLGVYWSGRYITYTTSYQFSWDLNLYNWLSFTMPQKKNRNKWQDAYKICINR